MRILVIVNPKAGNGKTLRYLPKIKKWLTKWPHDFIWIVSQSSDEMCSEIINAPARNINAVLLVGGDGTVHEALEALEYVNLPFGLIPCGRGNDYARNIGIPLDYKKNCSIPMNPSFKKVDLPKINDIPFGSIACIGFDAEVNKLARDKKGYFGGTTGYVICVLRALKKFIPFNVEIEIDKNYWKGQIMMVAIANGPFYGGGMRIAPAAKMDDGMFDICIIEEVSKYELLKQFPRVFKGNHISHPKVTMKTGKNINVRSIEPQEIFADGEYVGELPAVCTVEKQKIELMLPQK